MAEYSSFGTSKSNASVVEDVKKQFAVASAQQLLQKMSEKCFQKCISYPSSELDSKEQKCLSSCADRFMEAWNTVSQTYSARLQKGHSSNTFN